VVINQFNVKRITALKPEDDAPVGPNRHRPQAFQVTFEWMQAITRKVKRLRRVGLIEASENVLCALAS